MVTSNPIFLLGFLDDIEVQKTCLKWLQKHQKRRMIKKAKVLPETTTASQIYRAVFGENT